VKIIFLNRLDQPKGVPYECQQGAPYANAKILVNMAAIEV